MSDIDIMGANAEAEPATASIAAAKRESMLSRNNSVGWGNPRQNPVTNLVFQGKSLPFWLQQMAFMRACAALALAGSAAAFAPMMSMDMGRREVFNLPAALCLQSRG